MGYEKQKVKYVRKGQNIIQNRLKRGKIDNILSTTKGKKMMDIGYYKKKVERLEKVINMRECQLRCACDGLESLAFEIGDLESDYGRIIKHALKGVDAIYDLHKGEKIENGFLGEPHKRG